MRRGAVLVFSLVVMAITALVTSALSYYYVNTAGVARFYAEQRSSRRVGASRAVRTTLDKVVERLEQIAGTTQSTPDVGINIQGKSMSEVLDGLAEAVVKSVTVEGVEYQLAAEVDKVQNTLKVTAKHGGVPIVSATVELESSAPMSTLPVFDYVYFADNNGRLNSNYIIANGEVGSNGNFDLIGATVNGYLRYLNTVNISGDPHAWLQGAYMAKVATEFKHDDAAQNVFEQARPTNPALLVANGTASSVAWAGGYEYPEAANPFSWDPKRTRPVPLEDPTNDEPSEPPKPQRLVSESSNQPSASSIGWKDLELE